MAEPAGGSLVLPGAELKQSWLLPYELVIILKGGNPCFLNEPTMQAQKQPNSNMSSVTGSHGSHDRLSKACLSSSYVP